MNDDSELMERIDLRFRAAPTRPLPGGLLPKGGWIWFCLGLVAGVAGWVFGQRQLTSQLTRQITPKGSAAEVLWSLEALGILGADTEVVLAKGLQHQDTRVARSAWEKLNLCVDRWEQDDTKNHYAAMQRLAEQLQSQPSDLPAENQRLARSLAARLYARCVALDDPQLSAVTDLCQRTIANSTLSEPATVMQSAARLGALATPPTPLPNFPAPPLPLEQSKPLTETMSVHSSTSSPLTSQRVLSLPTGLETRSPAGRNEVPATPMQLSDSSTEPSAANRFQYQYPSGDPSHGWAQADSAAQPGAVPSASVDLPMMVKTSASISQHSPAQFRLISNRFDRQGFEQGEIAGLVRLLGSQQPNVAKSAALALRKHGFDDERIELATQLAVGSASQRLALIQQLAISDCLDPRPWLIWMAQDGQAEVRSMSVSLLASMLDNEVQRSLRMLMATESDTHVKEQIRKALLNAGR
ncbi:MAG: hypothetical protein KF752_12250 [Pirellulaceae bacterium]|nr:hypothetical protein [Pirellulaceae bacterium]